MPQSLNSEMLAKIIDASSIPSFVINKEHIIIHWNKAMATLSNTTSEDVIGTSEQQRAFYYKQRPSLADLIVEGASDKEFEEFYSEKYRKSNLIEGACEAEDFFPEFGKTGRWIHFTASPIRTNDGNIIGAIETFEDVTQLKAAEDNLRYYLKEITRTQEEERKRISRELHDDTAQVFGSLSRQLDNFLRKNHTLSTDEVLFLKDIQAQLNQGYQNLHRFCQGLRLSVLDDLGLIPALRSLVNGVQADKTISANLKVIGEIKRCPPETESMLFRIVQEGVNNIKKHAQASRVHVVIEFSDHKINITISDNGRGFILKESLDELPRSGKLGLAGIQERARLLGGTAEVISVPGKGTTLLVKVKY